MFSHFYRFFSKVKRHELNLRSSELEMIELNDSDKSGMFDLFSNELLQHMLSFLNAKELNLIKALNKRFKKNAECALIEKKRAYEAEIKSLFDENMLKGLLAISNKTEAMDLLTLIANHSNLFFEAQDAFHIKLQKLAFWMMQLSEIMLYLTKHQHFVFTVNTGEKTRIATTAMASFAIYTEKVRSPITSRLLNEIPKNYADLLFSLNNAADHYSSNNLNYLSKSLRILNEACDKNYYAQDNFPNLFQKNKDKIIIWQLMAKSMDCINKKFNEVRDESLRHYVKIQPK